MDKRDAYAILRLLKVKGVGHVLATRVIRGLFENDTGLADLIDTSTSMEPLRSWLSDEQVAQWRATDEQLGEEVGALEERGAIFVSSIEQGYPRALLKGPKVPALPILTCLGNTRLLEADAVGFCGSRRASERGLEVARDCTKQLVEHGVVAVSGYAAGVDQETHLTALAAGGATIIVLPDGLLRFQVRKALEEVWDWSRVLVVSEFLPAASWTTSRAMQRNSTIIGLGGAMILIEAGANGGSMDAGRKTLQMKRKLYAPVYDGMPEFAIGNHLLLREGATPLMRNRATGRANLSALIAELNSPPDNTSARVEQRALL